VARQDGAEAMTVVLAVVAAYGVFLVYTSVALGWRGLQPGPHVPGRRHRSGGVVKGWLAQAGLADVDARQFGAVVAALFVLGFALVLLLFGAVLPAVVGGLFASTMPVASYRSRRQHRRAEAAEAWPRLIEEIRLQTGSLGRSVPQALFEVGRRGPVELRSAFDAAEREWLLATDFTRTVVVLKERLADPTADATLETLLVAHEVGGTDLDRRLAALVEDRTRDLQGRKDARAKQAGVRFARRFVLAVPVGMALAGLSIGSGRDAYRTAIGQLAVVTGIAVVVACWLWSGRLMKLPEEDRVFR
jgi:tight adherence protein B